MRIFKIVGFLSLLCAQDVTIHSIDSLVVSDSLGILLENNPIELRLKKINHESAIYSYHSIQINPDQIIISGLESLTNPIQSKLTHPFKQGEQSLETINQIANQIKNQYYFIRDNPSINIGYFDSTKYGAKIDFKPIFLSHFSGLMGANKINNKWDYHGELNFGLENIFHRGEAIGFQWNRIDSLTQDFNFYWEEPHPFGWSLGAGIGLKHELVNGLFSQVTQEGHIQLYPVNIPVVKIGFIQGETKVTDRGKLNGYESDSYGAMSISIFSDTGIKRFLPRTGHILNMGVNLGLRGNEMYSFATLDYLKRWPISNKFHSTIRYQAQGIQLYNRFVPKSHYIRYGGVGSLRGFDNKFFSTTQMQLISFESEIQPNATMAFTGFLDLSTESINLLNPSNKSFGVGLKQLQENLELSLTYAIPWGEKINLGKLHVKWVSRI